MQRKKKNIKKKTGWTTVIRVMYSLSKENLFSRKYSVQDKAIFSH